MSTKRTISIGLAGNPNTGKTTLFNAITGLHQKTGNYPGVTVEKKEGRRIYSGVEFIVYDLPGTYSLTAYSMDEIVTRDFILEDKPDVIIDTLDSTNPERNLYLCLQFQELGIPVIGALNITDQAEKMGIYIDENRLSGLLGIPMIKTVGANGSGIEKLLDAVIQIVDSRKTPRRSIFYGNEMETEVSKLISVIESDQIFSKKYPPRWLAIKLLEKDINANQKISAHKENCAIIKQTRESIDFIESHFGADSEVVVSEQRYAYIHGAAAESVRKNTGGNINLSERADIILLNRIIGLPIFLFILWSIFNLTFKLGEYPMGWLESFFTTLASFLSGYLQDGLLKSFVIDGIIGGVGGVFSFVPLIIILFLCISILEDTGYMARAAFIMDKFLHIFGLHGQSFLPMMVGFGCSVPAIMAARTLKNPIDRIITIIVIPFMSCGAKLPVYILLAGAFFPQNSANMVMLIYLIGVTMALLSAILLRKTILKGDPAPFVMELPPYRMPTLRGILWHVTDKTGCYIKKAGTILLAASILIWAMVSFPKPPEDIVNEISKTEIRIVDNVAQAEKELSYSIAGKLGRLIEPAVKPLGFNWKTGIAAITGLAAKEAVVSTLGVLYKVGNEENEESASLREALKNDGGFSPLVAFVLMLFTLIVPPCLAALSTIKAELGWKWLGFTTIYLLTLGWIVCFAVYQIGKLSWPGI